MTKQRWDRYAIAAEVKRRGSTLEKISTNAGLSSTACSMALNSPFIPSAEKALSDFLKIPAWELWPERYLADGTRKVISYRDHHLNRVRNNTQCLKQATG